MTSYTKFAVKGVGVVFVFSIIAAFLGYLVRLMLARNLTVEEFGLFYAVFAFLGMIGIFKSLGFDKALVKFIPEFRHRNRDDLIKSSIIYVAAIELVTNSIIITAVYLFSNFLAVHFFNNSQASIILRLMAIAFFIDSFVVIVKYVLQAFKKIIYFSGIDLIRMLLIMIMIVIGFKAGYGIGSPIVAYIITPLILLVIFSIILFKKAFPEFFHTKILKGRQLFKTLSEYKINKYSMNIMLISAGGMILGYTDIMVLTYFSGLAAVGLYSIALPTTRVLIYFARAIAGILIPLTSDLWVKGKKNLLKIGMEELYKYSFIILVPAALTLFSFADVIINIFFGSDYILAATAMRILSIGMIFHIIYSINADFLSGIGHPHVNSKNIGLAAIFNLIGNLILIPLIGINGAAITTMMSYLMMMIYSTIKIRKFIDVRFPIIIWIKVIFIGAVFVLLTSILKRLLTLNVWIETSIVLIVSGLCYIILLFVMDVINQKELKNIYKRIFS
tara:strand:+ start:2643 stop:4148 length:1506 start_codon:yes stop_codon:yes gene_type:complete